MKHLVCYFIGFFSLVVITVNAQNNKSSLGKGVQYTPADSSFSLKFGVRIQPLFTTNFRDFEKFDEPKLNETQAMIRRARLKFDGYVYNPKWIYKFELAFGNRNIGGISEYTSMGARIILDAVIKYQATPVFQVWFGQTKLPGNRERVVSSQNLQFVDRNIVNSRFNQDRDIGFQIHGKHKIGNMPVATAAAISMGEGRNITVANMGGFEYTLRGEIFPLGTFSSKKGAYSESDLDREPKPKLAIGASFDYNDRAVRTRGNQGDFMIPDLMLVSNSLSTYWVDFIFKYRGWSVQGEWSERTSKNDPRVYDENGDLYNTFYIGNGLNLQTGYVFKSNWELAGRVSLLSPDERVTNQVNQYTIGVSKYIARHYLKIQTDLTYSDYKSLNGDVVKDPLMFRLQMEISF